MTNELGKEFAGYLPGRKPISRQQLQIFVYKELQFLLNL